MRPISSSSQLDSLRADIKLTTQRLAVNRDVLIAVVVALTGLGMYILLYRTTAIRDLADIRNEQFKVRADSLEAHRLADGIGKSFDQYKDDQKVEKAELAGQISVVRRILTWAAGILTTLLVAALLYWLRI